MYKTKIIAVCNQKGGVGKTTTVANLGYALAKLDKDVLLIDFDSQSSLTTYLNIGLAENERYRGIVDLLTRELDPQDNMEDYELYDMPYEQLLKESIHRPSYLTSKFVKENGKQVMVDVPVEFGFDLVPASLDLADYELYIQSVPKRNAFRLAVVIDKILKYHEYDYVLIDCNPSLGIMTTNAIIAATNGVIIPTNLDLMSTRGVRNLIDRICQIQETMQRANGGELNHMGVIGIALNLFRASRTVDKTIQEDLERFYPFTIFKNTIPESVQAKKALFDGVIYSMTYKKAFDAYTKLAKEIEKEMKKMEKEGPKIKYLDAYEPSQLEEDENEKEE